MTIETPIGRKESYEILLDFPFTSESKRMGIIIKNKENDDITFYIKGAETAICERVTEDTVMSITESPEVLSMEGLLTLIFAKIVLNFHEYNTWTKRSYAPCAAEIDR